MNQQCIYHIMIDRFAGYASKQKERCFYGGNLRGIINNLDYIKALGCNGIMLTPFYKSNQYHGYHILDYGDVDVHFGKWDDVDNLVNTAHQLGMTVTADFVANHCHINNPLVKNHPNWFKLRKDGNYKFFMDIDCLPQFNLNIEDVQDYIIDKAKELCHHGFDAIRLDYAKGPSLKFWIRFREEIKKEYPNVLLIGEVWGMPKGKHLNSKLAKMVNDGNISKQEAWQMSYIGIFDGVLDFEYQSLLCKIVRRKQRIIGNKELKDDVAKHFNQYAKSPDYQLWLFLDNHDTNRFLFESGGNIELLKEAITFTLSQNRPYLLYYGTEKAMTNKSDIFSGEPYADEQVRESMKWNNESIIKNLEQL